MLYNFFILFWKLREFSTIMAACGWIEIEEGHELFWRIEGVHKIFEGSQGRGAATV